MFRHDTAEFYLQNVRYCHCRRFAPTLFPHGGNNRAADSRPYELNRRCPSANYLLGAILVGAHRNDIVLFGPVTGLDGRFAPLGGKSYGCHQFLNWWPPHATGMGHLIGFESETGIKKSRAHKRSAFFGAGDRTRTGTPSLAVDFESTTSTIPSHRHELTFIV